MQGEHRIKFDLQRFAEEGAAGSDAGGKGGDGGKEGKGDEGKSGGDGDKVTFTADQQAALDKIIAERVSRAEKTAGKKAQEARAKELGFDSVEAMEAAVKAHKDAQEKGKSDLEKAQEQARKAEEERTKALDTANQRLIRAEVTLQSAALGIVDADAAFALMDRGEVKVDDDGKISGVKESLEALIKTKPYLKGQDGKGGPGKSGGEFGGGQGGGKTFTLEQIDAMSMDEINKNFEDIAKQMEAGQLK